MAMVSGAHWMANMPQQMRIKMTIMRTEAEVHEREAHYWYQDYLRAKDAGDWNMVDRYRKNCIAELIRAGLKLDHYGKL